MVGERSVFASLGKLAPTATLLHFKVVAIRDNMTPEVESPNEYRFIHYYIYEQLMAMVVP